MSDMIKSIKISKLGPILILVAALSACSSDSAVEPVSQYTSSPEAAAGEDTKSGGVYKGVIAGSTGIVKVVLQKGVIEMKITLDGVSKTLTTTALASWTSGEPIKNVLFTIDDWQATFSVAINGANPGVSLTIPGHANAEVVLLKETSKAIVRLFEGAYTGTESGTWNFVVKGAELGGVSKSVDGLNTLLFFGLVNGNVITLDTIKGSGTISGDNVSGTWEVPGSTSKGAWTGKRVM